MRFPKIVALAAFVLYVLTLSRGMTLNSLPITAKITGWDWVPMTSRPLTWLLTLPLHLLPVNWVPFAFNLLSAAFAALTLGLLARCVMLLPWDCAPDGTRPWLVRLPALLAVAVCGLEYSFWQEAVAATGEMLDVFLLMIPVWCLLEYRLEKEQRWLNAAALVWGLGMAENWVMLMALPLFIAAMIALRGMRFFKLDFVLRLLLLGLAGFSVYVLLPLAHWLNPHSPWNFGESWLVSFRSTKAIFHLLYYNFWSWHRLLVVSVLLYFLVPALPCFVRLKNMAANNVSPVDRFQIWIYSALRMALLLACVWLAFDPMIGPREIIRQQLGMALPLLTFNVINALGIAFLVGNFLFLALLPPQRRSRTPLQKFNSLVRRHTPALFTGLAVLIAAGLLCRSLPPILQNNRQSLTSFGRLMARSLPPGGGIVLGGDSLKLIILQAALMGRADGHQWQVVDWRFLPDPKYRASLERSHPSGWLALGGKEAFKPYEAIQLLDRLAVTNRLFFLQPHSGEILFERFQPLPLGELSELKHYPENSFDTLPERPQQLAEVEKYWDDAWRGGMMDLEGAGIHPSRLVAFLKRHLTLSPVSPDQSVQLARWHSAAVNDWGVTLQQAGQLAGAQRWFEAALALNTNNLAAQVNLNCCTNLIAGNKLNLSGATQAAERFRDLLQLAQVINVFGDFDDPGIRCVLGNAWLEAGWPRQAWLEFDRARTLVPEAVTPQLAMAQIYSRYRFDAEVFKIVDHLRPLVTNSPAGNTLELELSMLEAKSWLSQTNPLQADKVFNALLQSHPDDPMFMEMVFKAYVAFGEMTNALKMVNARLEKEPDNIAALNNKAALLIQNHDAAAAIPVLDRALSLTNLPSIRLNRAIAFMQVSNMAAAGNDYAMLEDSTGDQFSIHYGMAQIALLRQDTNQAVHHFELCLSNSPPASLKWQQIRSRLAALKQ